MALFNGIILVACLAVYVSGAFKTRDHADGVPRSATEGDVIRELLARDVKYGIPQSVGALQVKLGLYVEAVTEVDVETGTVEVVGFLTLVWEDPRLRFEHSDPFHEVKDVRLPASEVWRPDIELYTSVTPGMQIMNTARDQVMVEYNGTVNWYPMVGLRILCADLSFNKTEINCALRIGSWTYQKHAMEMAVNHPMSVLSQYRPTGQWTVSAASAERVEAKYECCPDTYVFVAYNLTLKRRDL